MTILEALTAELDQLTEAYRLSVKHAARVIEDYATRNPTDHFGHNLAARAAELSALAGKIDSVQRTLNFVRSQEAK